MNNKETQNLTFFHTLFDTKPTDSSCIPIPTELGQIDRQ